MINRDELESFITYDKESGKLFWKGRKEVTGYDKNFNKKYANKVAGCVKRDGYRYITIKRETYLAHRLAWFLSFGVWPKEYLDHINRNKDDNRLCNLREVSHSENLRNCNKRVDNISGTTGVHFDSERSLWRAVIGTGKNQKIIGRFKTKKEAIEARLEQQKLYNYHETHGQNTMETQNK